MEYGHVEKIEKHIGLLSDSLSENGKMNIRTTIFMVNSRYL